MTQHELLNPVRVVPEYEVSTLGAPFRVILRNSAQKGYDQSSGRELVHIPDLVGLISGVVRTRAVHPRKLNGQEIVFFRKALGVKARVLAGFLDISPEHLSRCEGDTKVLSSATERMLRLFVFLATFYERPEELLLDNDGQFTAELKKGDGSDFESTKLLETVIQRFLMMKIQPLHDPNELLEFDFVWHSRSSENGDSPSKFEDGDWSSKHLAA